MPAFYISFRYLCLSLKLTQICTLQDRCLNKINEIAFSMAFQISSWTNMQFHHRANLFWKKNILIEASIAEAINTHAYSIPSLGRYILYSGISIEFKLSYFVKNILFVHAPFSTTFHCVFFRTLKCTPYTSVAHISSFLMWYIHMY